MTLLEYLKKLVMGIVDGPEAAAPEPEPEQETAAEPDNIESLMGWDGNAPWRFVDVSRWQGEIKMEDWAKVKAAGYSGVMLRALGNKSNRPYIDPTFEDNYRNATAAGLDVGVYYYTKATTKADADRELALLKSVLKGKCLTMPVAVDMEDDYLTLLSRDKLTDLAAYELEQVEQMGFYAWLYTYTSFAENRLDMKRLAGRWDVWLADYTGKTPKVSFAYGAHQHTSRGSVPGIEGPVDCSVTTRNYPKIILQNGLTGLKGA